MTIPDYQSFMLPFLKILGDRNEHTLQEIYIKLADYFKSLCQNKNIPLSEALEN
ncbi:hypothetical protein ABEU95_02055 [Heyndrickxia faecalis]|nr:hypothetical protein [Heyndrickxia coagulans]